MNPGSVRFRLFIFGLTSFLLPLAALGQDDRAADRAAIKAHIESIFQAFINKDNAALRATHAENWLWYLVEGRTMIKGIGAYMDWSTQDPKQPYGMKSYKFREFDMIFKGDAAFVCFVADTETNWPGNPPRVLRICDFYTKNDGKWIQSGSYTATHPESTQAEMAAPRQIGDQIKKRLLDARESVWRAYFAGDRVTLEKLIPEDTIAIDPGGDPNWSGRQKILEGSTDFAKSGGKLVKLEFPKTEIQMYGMTAVIYSIYSYDLEVGGKRTTNTGRVTEVFVLRNGQWVNPGWHMDNGN